MKSYFKSFTKKDYVFFIICAIIYYLIASQWYIIAPDDCRYRFHQQFFFQQNITSCQPINNLCDLLASNIYGYHSVNGRFLIHCFVQWFLSFGGVQMFFVLSTFVFILGQMSMLYLVRHNTIKIDGDYLLIITFIILLLPIMGSIFYGPIALTVNYMWGVTVYCTFFAIYFHIKRNEEQYPIWQNMLLAVFGFVCGGWQESFAVPIAGSLFFYHLFTIRKTKKSLLWLVIGFGLGAALLIFAPVNFTRLNSATAQAWSGGISHEEFVHYTTYEVWHNLFSVLWVILGVVSILIDLLKNHKILFVRENWTLFSIPIITMIFTNWLIWKWSYQGIWQLTIIVICDVIIVLRFISKYISSVANLCAKYYKPILIVLLLIYSGYIISRRVIMKNVIRSSQMQIIEKESDSLYIGNCLRIINKEMPKSQFLYDKTCPIVLPWALVDSLKDMTLFLTNGKRSFAHIVMPASPDSVISRINSLKSENDVYYCPYEYLAWRTSIEDTNRTCEVIVCANFNGTKQRLLPFIFHPYEVSRTIDNVENFQFYQDSAHNYYVYPIHREQWHTVNIMSGKLLFEENVIP